MAAFDIAKFRAQFPKFADETRYTDPAIELKSEIAAEFVTKGCNLSGNAYDIAWRMMTAHLLWIDYLLSRGQTTVGITVGATVDKVSVTNAPPPTRTGWQYWLMSTPFGAELYAFLMMKASGGWYIGGAPERAAFRGVGGRFGR